ncbi:MAG: type II toxin-antitoxin system Phd/YefM family antitoxin [Candidatus Dormibacteraceae bacterium]
MILGVRDFRNGLSKYLDEVRSGRTVTVTAHGKPIARVVPVGRPTRLEQLIAEGLVTPARRPKGPSPEPIMASGSVSDFISEQRG